MADCWWSEDVQVNAAVGEAELPLTELIKKEPTDCLPSTRSLLIVGDGVVGEQVGKVIPQTELDIVSVG
jgi:hypothetical protein